MSHQLPWQTLIEIAQKETDTAAQTLGHAVSQHQEAQNQLDMLLKYRDEYQGTLGAHSQNGLSIDSLKNHRGFIERLESVIQKQHEIVTREKQHIGTCRQVWQEQFYKMKSFATLAQRQAKTELQRRAKQEQRQLDEHTALRFQHKRHD
ncbi:MAG: flagellar export protein FliJ [Thiobacillaceae bacterium]